MRAPRGKADQRLRWEDYVLGREGSAMTPEALVSAAAGETSGGGALYVLGLGFDPRTMHGPRALLPLLPSPVRVLALDLGPSRSQGRSRDLQQKNRAELEALCDKHGAELVDHPYPEPMEDGRRAGVRIARDLAEKGYDAAQVIVDVSALRATVFFAVVAAYLERPRAEGMPRQLQVVVTENPDADDLIEREGAQSPIAVPGFDGGLDLSATEGPPRVWAPVLGVGQEPQLEAIMAALEPAEVCPVLPFPARNPRRGDDLLREHHRLLFETFDVEPRNFIYADERNPFDLYRTLSALQDRYAEVLEPLGEATVVPSTHSSKMLSVGVMLAAWEHGLPVMNAGPVTSHLRPGVTDALLGEVSSRNELTCLWLDGAPYA